MADVVPALQVNKRARFTGLFSHSLVGFYLLKYATDVLLIAPAIVGVIFLAGRVS